jgi:hypothetical protein
MFTSNFGLKERSPILRAGKTQVEMKTTNKINFSTLQGRIEK